MMRRDQSIEAIADKYIGRNGAPKAPKACAERFVLPEAEDQRIKAALWNLSTNVGRIRDLKTRTEARQSLNDLREILKKHLGVVV